MGTSPSFIPIKIINEPKIYGYSDGVTTIKKSLFNIIQEWIDPKYTDEDLKQAVIKYQHCPPNSKESLYYRYVPTIYVLWLCEQNIYYGLHHEHIIVHSTLYTVYNIIPFKT